MNAMNATFYSLRVAIIEDLPKPVKNACDALPSAVVSDNAIGVAEVKNSGSRGWKPLPRFDLSPQ
jgi:hypothetical protein